MKGQTTLEFVLLFTVVMLATLGTLYFAVQKMVQVQDDRLQRNAEAINNIFSTEVRLAERAEGNYTREFGLPVLVDGKNYSVRVFDGYELSILYDDREYVFPLDSELAYVKVEPGENRIYKTNGTVYIGDRGEQE